MENITNALNFVILFLIVAFLYSFKKRQEHLKEMDLLEEQLAEKDIVINLMRERATELMIESRKLVTNNQNLSDELELSKKKNQEE